MGKTFVLSFVLLLYGVSLQAQPGNPASDGGHSPGDTSDLTNFTGCLTLSLGQYKLTEDDGTVHLLAGSTGKLRHEVGHEIEATGKLETRTQDATDPGGASTVVYKQFLVVKSFKHIDDTCK